MWTCFASRIGFGVSWHCAEVAEAVGDVGEAIADAAEDAVEAVVEKATDVKEAVECVKIVGSTQS